jgi:hypothetical protein
MVERSPLTAEPQTAPTATAEVHALHTARSPVEPSRLGVYSALGATVAAVPLPWVPDSLARRVRGALVHDIAVRRGLSLTREARDVLADPAGPDVRRGVVSQAVRYLGMRFATRLLTSVGPVGLFWPAQHAVRTYVLGRMFDRYIERWRTERAVRIDADEARRVRRAIDAALTGAINVQLGPTEEPTPVDDQRDPTTALIDALLGTAAGLPERLLRRVEAAFDDRIAQSDG